MDKPRHDPTKGEPWSDVSEPESVPVNPRPEEYGDDDADLSADERANQPSRGTERESYEDRPEREGD